MNRKMVWISSLIVAALILACLLFQWVFLKRSGIDTNGTTLDGNSVVILLDGNNKATRYWVIQNDWVELKDGWVSFDDKDGQTIHLHSNVIVKEFDNDQVLNDIKKQYELK
ncbi:hypothetical protein SAMN04487897_102549 [Paenibacillus sp. yr247]|uniref:hypothetical protein n=1 Tax=Paenibacillus sp. yr247 TaxID=1761880 RepID=UPI0008826F89|nr:hypothetical protein [Paenibacillus sp. yr247]SDN33596.1 hypothetical protein SAMN04487897_102549 [Paenibacillus sp. yr247]